MGLKQGLIAELQNETLGTKRMIAAVPTDKFSWKPHEKSLSLIDLSYHIVGLVSWVELIIKTRELDLATYQNPSAPQDTEGLLRLLEENLEKGIQAIESETDESLLNNNWKLRIGDHEIFDIPKAVAIRSVCFNHLYHHRGQLSLYLRLLDLKVPGMYGPSHDEI